MIELDTVRTLLRYSDWANGQILRASARLGDEPLDRPFDMGRGSLRLTLMHIHAGEYVWLQRWGGKTETPWPDEEEHLSVVTLAESFGQMYARRDGFLKGLSNADLARPIVYRDSKGSLFTATLGNMMLQMCVHSMHHRSQAVNMLRRLGAAPPELDYMMWVRKPG